MHPANRNASCRILEEPPPRTTQTHATLHMFPTTSVGTTFSARVRVDHTMTSEFVAVYTMGRGSPKVSPGKAGNPACILCYLSSCFFQSSNGSTVYGPYRPR